MRSAVVPLAGTWIEIGDYCSEVNIKWVVPLAGTWIEMDGSYAVNGWYWVVPLAGTWIEMYFQKSLVWHPWSRSPCGDVD